MRNKKMAAMLAVASLSMVSIPIAAQAMTIGVEVSEGEIDYYTYQLPDEEKAIVQIEKVSNDGASSQQMEQFERQQMKESLAFLEKFGVTYNLEENAVYYQGEKVRWLIDEQLLGSYTTTYHTEGGKIDLFTIRDKDGAVTGVRKATQEEFAQRDDIDEYEISRSYIEASEKDISEKDVKYMEMITTEDDTPEIADNEGKENEGILKQDTFVITEDDEIMIMEDGVIEVTYAETGSEMTKEEQQRELTKMAEYAKIGIGKDESGCWTWEGKAVYCVMDEDGSFSTFGYEEAKKNRIYLYVSRDEQGNAIKAEAISGKELLEQKAMQDAKRDLTVE